MVEARAGDEKIRKFLRETAAEEKKEYSVLTNRESTSAQRSAAIKKMAQPREYLSGFLSALSLVYGEEAAKFYENYFYQARSDEGVLE